jgi:hypothetical protein
MRRIRKYMKRKFRSRLRKIVAVFTALSLINQIVFPTAALALTGGPSQPEVQSFEPIGTSDMVDPFTGDFSYNIPLMDVEGYPINIAYHSGITMDQEASWVGLGWNINPGVVNRNVRGIPDDFDGDVITREFNTKVNKTIGINLGAGLEIAGFSNLGISYSLGVKYNNYTGVSAEQSLNLSISVGSASSGSLTGGLGITSSSDEGLTIAPSIGLSKSISEGDSKTNLGLHVGTSINSREGMKSLTVGASVSQSQNVSAMARSANTKEDAAKNNDYKDKSGNDTYSSGQTLGSPAATFNFGQPTYTPNITMPTQNYSVTGNFKLGLAFFATHPNFTIGGYYSEQSLIQNTINSPAYGYLHSDEGVSNDYATMDFNREKDQSFNESTPALPIPNYTFDVYSVSGQGVGGSYRPFRGDIGHVYDAASYCTSTGFSIGGEVGLGDLTHVGVDITVNSVNSTSGRWSDENGALPDLYYKSSTGDPTYEKAYFKEANEKSVNSDPSFMAKIGGTDAVRIQTDLSTDFYCPATNNLSDGTVLSSANYRTARDKRNQEIAVLTHGEMNTAAIDDPSTQNIYSGAPNHHIGEITTYGTDGKRYVYGIAAYNKHQEETTFAVGTDINGNPGFTGDCQTGLVSYNPGAENSIGNTRGIDNYYTNTITPPFAHSFLLTEVLSSDYVDSDNQRGPSDGDLGDYTKFYYGKIPDYQWRVPAELNQASFNEGLKSDKTDDKANYMYGTKELWYLEKIETKNYVCTFTTEGREDARGVIDKNGGIDPNPAKASQLLRTISLYTKPAYKAWAATGFNPAAAPPAIKQVHFEYDYSLCGGVSNNTGNPVIVNGIDLNANKGKLTLQKIYFTYQNSNKSRLSPYTFVYPAVGSGGNPNYNIKSYDRWGCYKPNLGTCAATDATFTAPEFPYVDQNNVTEDVNVSAWTLNQINLPSGGNIQLQFESDDYAYVQNKQANQMFLIRSADVASNPVNSNLNFGGGSTKYYFDCQPDPYHPGNYITDINKYISGINMVYFRFMVDMGSSGNGTLGSYEYVPGYAQLDPSHCGIDNSGSIPRGYITLVSCDLKNDGTGSYSPILRAAIQFGRVNTPRIVYDEPPIADGAPFGEQVLTALAGSNFAANIAAFIAGPNNSIYNNFHCQTFVPGKSWVRLACPTQKKLGGGLRVHSVTINDAWDTMTGSAESAFNYGQVYDYTLDDGTSSGVASYEPQQGGDENPWKQPVFFEIKKLLVPDDKHYLEEPFGETFFPSASVGYSRVTVRNLQRAGVTHHATGKVVHEFYTAKDFPTITERTDILPKRDKSDPLSLSSLLSIDVRDFMTASQGFKIELNDMHGKPKSQSVYQEGQTVPITSVEYYYKTLPYLADCSRLTNTVTVINKDGSIGTADIGMFSDFTTDFRQSQNSTISAAVQLNLDIFDAVVPVLVPSAWPSFTSQLTQFRSAVANKVIQRFGILDRTVAKDLSSVVETNNLAYDAETGEVLLTQTTTDFNDKVYSLTYPAHWYYDGMGQVYKNIGVTIPIGVGAAGVYNVPNAATYFSEGDQVLLSSPSTTLTVMAWVTGVNTNSINLENKMGFPQNSAGLALTAKIIRPGRRNQQNAPIAKLTTLSNPLSGIASNTYQQVLQASATVFTNLWRTYCDCFDQAATGTNNSTNPYVLGTRGFFKPQTSYLHLTDRTQSSFDNNTNIRKDGIFTAYLPFFKLVGGKWVIDGHNWTFTSTVTEYSAFGPEIENQDALGRYSAAEFGYNETFATAVSANARYRDIGFDGFEDYDFSHCADNHFKFNQSAINISNTQSHTGQRSIEVAQGTPVTMSKQLTEGCTHAPGCTLKDCFTFVGRTIQINVTGASGAYTLDWNVINGSVNVMQTAYGLVISNTTGNLTSFTIDLTITDSAGCIVTNHLVYNSTAVPAVFTGINPCQ